MCLCRSIRALQHAFESCFKLPTLGGLLLVFIILYKSVPAGESGSPHHARVAWDKLLCVVLSMDPGSPAGLDPFNHSTVQQVQLEDTDSEVHCQHSTSPVGDNHSNSQPWSQGHDQLELKLELEAVSLLLGQRTNSTQLFRKTWNWSTSGFKLVQLTSCGYRCVTVVHRQSVTV